MSVDTCAKLKGHIYPEQIINCISENCGTVICNDVKIRDLGFPDLDSVKEVYGNDLKRKKIFGFITFEYKNVIRDLFYFYSNLNYYENLDYYSQFGLEDMVKS